MITVAITDDHLMVLEGLKLLLNSSEDICVIETFSTITEMKLGLENKQPDVLLLDINLPDGNGVVACKEVIKKYPTIKIIGLTNYEETGFIKQMIQNGAKGYLLKNTGKEELITAIKSVIKDELYLPETLKQQLFEASLGQTRKTFIPKISKRELEVLQLIAEEFTTEEIAEKLFVTRKTIEAHRSHLIQKLGVRNTAGLIRVAIEKGIL